MCVCVRSSGFLSPSLPYQFLFFDSQAEKCKENGTAYKTTGACLKKTQRFLTVNIKDQKVAGRLI